MATSELKAASEELYEAISVIEVLADGCEAFWHETVDEEHFRLGRMLRTLNVAIRMLKHVDVAMDHVREASWRHAHSGSVSP